MEKIALTEGIHFYNLVAVDRSSGNTYDDRKPKKDFLVYANAEKESKAMKIRDMFQMMGKTTITSENAEILSRYKQMRQVSTDINRMLVERLSKGTINGGAKRLGIFQRNSLVIRNPEEMEILFDYCIYCLKKNDRLVFEQYLIDSPPVEASDEMVCLRAMQQAVFSLFVVDSVDPGFALTVRNIVSNETHLLVDVGLSSSCKPGLLFASRLLFFEGFAMTTGIAYPVGRPFENELLTLKKELAKLLSPNKDGYTNPTSFIKSFLMEGCSSCIEFRNPFENRNSNPTLSVTQHQLGRIGRNSPCPCGSGRKYKRCCQKHG